MLCNLIIFAQPPNNNIMATIKAFIRTGKKDKESNIRFRLSDGRGIQMFHKSDLTVSPLLWDDKKEQYKAKCLVKAEERLRLNTLIAERKKLILSIYSSSECNTSKDLDQLIDMALHPEKYSIEQADIYSLFEQYYNDKKLPLVTVKNMNVLVRCLKRYELFKTVYENNSFNLNIDTISGDILEDFESFMRNEHTLYKEYPEIYSAIPYAIDANKKVVPQERGHNTIVNLMRKFRMFYGWCIKKKITANYPFSEYSMKAEVYGTPIYITLEERNIIADFDLSSRPALELQRDIFIFQCLIGCRVSDLFELTSKNIINDIIEYIPNKTKDERAMLVRVPLNDRAKQLIEKYKGVDCKGRLFPFISSQKYNDDIKEVFKVCGITRMVTTLNPITRKEEQVPINEIASSHMARRTFVGNLYKKVKDPNLVGSLSGHKEGSKAFARYRDIDDDIKKELVSLIE